MSVIVIQINNNKFLIIKSKELSLIIITVTLINDLIIITFSITLY